MKQTISIALIAACALAQGNSSAAKDAAFLKYEAKFGKNPKDKADYEKRKNLYEKAMEKAAEHNNSKSKWKMGENVFSDMTPDEKKEYLGIDPEQRQPPHKGSRRLESMEDAHGRQLAKEVYEIDWVERGVMSPVKNQGNCGSCWAFVGTSVLEAMEVIHGSGKAPDVLSTQQAVDCTYIGRSVGGCSGGWPSDYWWQVAVNFAAATEASYPYEARDEDEAGARIGCRTGTDAAKVVYFDWEGFYNTVTPSRILTKLLSGPLSILVGVDEGFMAYSGGVLDSSATCPNAQWTYNHVVVLTGYREEVEVEESQLQCEPPSHEDGLCRAGFTDNGTGGIFNCCKTIESQQVTSSVWTAQNSWGSGWGEDGFVRIEAQEGNGVCGMNWLIQYVWATDSAFY